MIVTIGIIIYLCRTRGLKKIGTITPENKAQPLPNDANVGAEKGDFNPEKPAEDFDKSRGILLSPGQDDDEQQ